MLLRCPRCAAIIHLEAFGDSPEVVTCWMCTSAIPKTANGSDGGPATLASPHSGSRERPVPIGLADSIFLEASNPALGEGERIKLHVVEGPSEGAEFEVAKSITTIGRTGGGADIEIDDPEVSRAHCAVEVRRDAILLHDLRSTNGTYLRNSRVSVARLEKASKFRIGVSKLQLKTISPGVA
jgi:hypothetical protein